MSDYNSSLPIRTENNGDVVAKIADATTPSQQLAVAADGSISITDNGGSLTVDGTVELGATSLAALESITVQNPAGASAVNIQDGGNSITVDAANLDIRDLVFATDKVDASGSTLGANSGVDIGDVTINNAAGAAAVNIQDGGNSITVDGSLTVSATDLDIRDLVFATDKVDVGGSVIALDAPTLAALESITVQNGAAGAAVNIQDGGNSITVDGSVTVSATDLDIRDLTHVSDSVKVGDGTDFLAVNADGSINVNFTTPANTKVVNYNTSAAVASNASVNHDYTVTALKTFTGGEAWIAGSGKLRVELLVNAVVKFVGFNSTANPNIEIPLLQIVQGAAGQVIRMTITNKDNQPQDLYSTLVGTEI